AGDPHHHLVEMPAIAWPRTTLAQPSRDRGTEFQHPAPHRFVRDIESALGQQFLDIAVAQGEAKIQSNRVLDDLGWEAMTTVAEGSHPAILPDSPLPPCFRDDAGVAHSNMDAVLETAAHPLAPSRWAFQPPFDPATF